ncbi:MAG: hypothetical protein IT422_09590 [Pirellulaceae bacterium]|nr:hypothetical protein [Pirellulaceae bacterium]
MRLHARRRRILEQLEQRNLLAADLVPVQIDVNDDGYVSPMDALMVINHLNREGEAAYAPELDINGDQMNSPLDVLLVVNFLNSGRSGLASEPLRFVGPLASGESGPRVGRSPVAPPEMNDHVFVVDSGGDLDSGCVFRDDLANGTIRFEIPVDRVVGDIGKLLSNNLISPTIKLEMPAFDVDFNAPQSPQERDVVRINGHVVPSNFLTGANNVWKLNEFDVPIEFINFPTDASTPATNVVEIAVDTLSPPGDDTWCTEIDWASLTIDKVPAPVLLVHGILSNSSGWNTPWIAGLTDLGIPAEGIDLGSDQGLGLELDSIQQNAADIAARVEDMIARLGVDQISIVSHSKGGLDSRHYAESNDTIHSLIQIGTPNAGSPLADLIQVGAIGASVALGIPGGSAILNGLLGAAGVQLTTPFMLGYNWIHGLNPNTEYSALAGDYSTGSSVADFLLSGLMGGASDAVVPVSSVYSISGINSQSPIASTGNDMSAMHTGLVPAQAVYARLKGLASDPITAAEASGEGGEMLSLLSTKGLAVAQSQSLTFPMILDGSGVAQLALIHFGGELDYSLRSPSGIVYDDAAIAAAANVEKVAFSVEGLKLQTIEVRDAAFEEGTWEVTVTGTSVTNPQGAEPFTVSAFSTGSRVNMLAQTAPEFPSVGQDIIVQAVVTDGGAPRPGGAAQVWLISPSGDTSTAELLDDGTGADAAAGDGIYTAAVPATQSGIYRAQVNASAAGPGAFYRDQLLVIGVAQADIDVGNNFSARVVDTNGNTLHDALLIDVELVSSSPSDVKLRAVLETVTGDLVAESSTEFTSNGSSQTATLSFDGNLIYESGVDGPYQLRFVRLAEDSTLGFLPVGEVVSPAFQTEAYAFAEFEHDEILSTGIGSDEGIDLDGNGLFDRLDVTTVVSVSNPGNYNWSARLEDAAGNEIGFDSGNGFLSGVDAEIALRFNGSSIGQSGADGPYFVKDLFIFGASATSIADVYTTGLYKATQFESSVSVVGPLGIENLGTNSQPDWFVLPGQVTQLTGTLVGISAGYSLTLDWGDGTAQTLTAGPQTPSEALLSLEHVYHAGGVHEIKLSLTSGAVTYDDSTFAFISGTNLVDGLLSVVGSQKHDIVDVFDIGDGKLKVLRHAPGLEMSVLIANFEDVDRIAVYLGDGNDSAKLHGPIAVPTTMWGGTGIDTLIGGWANDELYGGPGIDYLYGLAGNDWLFGGADTDYIFGGQNDDLLIGGEGRDFLYGQQGNDQLEGGAHDDHLFGEEGHDLLLGGAGNDRLFGGIGDDGLFGDEGDDWLYGELGDDTLDGGDGYDWLFGGLGNDGFASGERHRDI